MTGNQQGSSPESLVREVIARWRGGQQPDAQEFLREHPQVRERKSLAIDLIYEEYCLRREHGETFVPSTFMSRFPAYKQSLVRMLDVHEFLAGSAAAPSWPSPGEEFLGFEVVEQIGAGAVARVFLAREVEVGQRLVVIKVSQFGRGEARLMGRISHPGVVPIHSVHEDPLSGMTCICMPFLGTATLVDVLDEAFVLGDTAASAAVIASVADSYLPAGLDPSTWGPIDPFFRGATYEEGVVHLGRQIAAALAKAHQCGITHRDIKPSNVLLSREGRPMLLDFNLSAEERLPAERIGGTLAYMAPERIETLSSNRGETETTTDPRSDLYSVGAMLYELLTGQLPSRPPSADGPSAATLEDWLSCRRAPPLAARNYNPRVEPALDAILQRTLAPRPEDRFASAEELADALAALLRPRARLARHLRRHRRAFLAAGIGLTATAAAAGAYWLTLPPLSERLFQAGLTAYDQGHYERAKDLFTRSIDAGNDSAEVYFARGQTQRQLKDAQAQENDFAEVAQRGQNEVGWMYAGFAAWDGGDAKKATNFFERTTNPRLISLTQALGAAYGDAGEYDEAVIEFDRIIAVESDNEDARFNRALSWFYMSNGQYRLSPNPQALKDAESLVKKHPLDVEIRNLAAFLASNAVSAGDIEWRDRAIEHLRIAEELETDKRYTFQYWRKVDPQAPAPPAGTTPPPLKLGWRLPALPQSPRLDVCIDLLSSQQRLP